MTSSRFDYRTHFPAPLRYGLGGFLVVAGVAGLVVFLAAVATTPAAILGMVAMVALVLAGAYVASTTVHVRADDTGVSAGLTPWPRSTFRWQDVASTTSVDVSGATGIGYRITGRRSRTVLAAPGRAVRFDLTDGRRVTVVCGDRSDELARLAALHP